MRTKAEVLGDLRGMLRDVLSAKAEGGNHSRIARAHGYVDGYMRAVLDLDVATKAELLDIVGAERERASGPAMRLIEDMTPASDTKIVAA
jgi:hypothetical protein